MAANQFFEIIYFSKIMKFKGILLTSLLALGLVSCVKNEVVPSQLIGNAQFGKESVKLANAGETMSIAVKANCDNLYGNFLDQAFSSYRNRGYQGFHSHRGSGKQLRESPRRLCIHYNSFRYRSL